MPEKKAAGTFLKKPSPPPPQPSQPRERSARDWLAGHKYSLTLCIILVAHIGLVDIGGRQAVLFTPVIILFLYFVGFLLVRDRSRLAWCILGVGLLALILSGLNMAVGGLYCLTSALTGHAVFLILLILYMLRRLFRDKKVSFDSIMAGIIVYLLLGGLWAQFYALTFLTHPGAVAITTGGGLGPHPYLTIYYFSVTCLTTAGLGDVVPISDMARILAAYESLVGQVYLVVFIALLMGRHFADR